MKTMFLTVSFILAAHFFLFAQTKSEVVSLLYEIDERATRFGSQIVFIEEFNFGIPGGANWFVEWQTSPGGVSLFIYVVDVDTRKIVFENFLFSDAYSIQPHVMHFDDLLGRTVRNIQIGDFNGKGFDMILDIEITGMGSFLNISGFDPKVGRIRTIKSFNTDGRDERPPVRFVTYRGMQGFIFRWFDPPQVAGGPTWTPDPPSPRAGRWFFYTWDAEQRTFVEVGEVDEAYIEGDWHPGENPAVEPIQEQNAITAYQLDADTVEETTPTVMPTVHQPIPVTSTAQPLFNGTATSPLLTWMWIVIASGVIGGIVLVVKRKKR
jgi:hypothetical protein